MPLLSQILAPTLREVPADAEVASHKLLLRAGFIRRVAGGIYNYYPLMWRVLKKITQIIEQEMDASGAQQLMMPILQPAELWQESGRWGVYGKELIRLKDRHARDMVLAPTHEEVITSIAKAELRSYRQLPCNLYQIQNKYRDEVRPRFGLLRGREFIMKDAYSFHSTEADLDREYEVMAQAYTRIFERCGLETQMVRSDSGAIGGSESHEYMVLIPPSAEGQESGENDVFYDEQSGYAANGNWATSLLPPANTTGDWAEPTLIETPKATSIAELEAQHKFRPETIVKALIYVEDDAESPPKTAIMALIRGDCDVEPIKLKNAVGADAEFRLASGEEVSSLLGGTSKGFIGPVNLPANIQVVADESVRDLKNFEIALNIPGVHAAGVNWGSAFAFEGHGTFTVHAPSHFVDIRLPKLGDLCPLPPHNPLKLSRGIEVGNIFKLGTKYSQMMSATFTDEDGTEKPFVMGCYGIGVSRVAASAVERYHDANGILWPPAIAPYAAIVVPVNPQDETQRELAQSIYAALTQAGVDTVYDDRDERAGVKFKDADLIGYPVRITVGKRAPEGMIELKRRDLTEAETVQVKSPEQVAALVQQALNRWGELPIKA
ncbi:MAG: proline--tRNA ligase [Vampirovibrionales bacterium]|nr:proline--tRNA ligase [Vampirovibrionales bacterium]